MKSLLETIVKGLVNNPDHIEINEIHDGDFITLELRVLKDDLGRVIGRQGRIAQAIRSVLKAAAIKANKRVSVKILEMVG